MAVGNSAPGMVDLQEAERDCSQALAAEYLAKEGSGLDHRVYPVPEHIDREIARLKLDTLGVKIDALTREQRRYLASWELGT